MKLELSEQAKRLVSTFLAYRNDVDIYTEDELKDKEFYKVLFNRLLNGAVKINDVTPLGSKDNVIDRCKNEPSNGRKKIFIVDGDVSIIHGNGVDPLSNLYVLDAYCVENFVINKDSVINFIYLNCGKKPIEEIESELDFENWLSEYSTKLTDLFIHFALIDFFGGRFTLFNIHKYHPKDVFLSDLVDKDIAIAKEEIIKLTTDEIFQAKYNELKIKWSNSIDHFMTIVSGKDYLIPLLLLKTRAFKSSKALNSVEEAKFSLVQFCNLDRLSNLKNVIVGL